MRYGKKITVATLNVLDNAIKKLDEHYGAVLAHWGEATSEQKQAFIEHSPILQRVIDWVAQWQR
jgi:hypothetical protein